MPTIDELKEEQTPPTPLFLFECTLRNGSVERWGTHAVSFEDDNYEARLLRHNLFELAASSEESKISVTLANADSRFSEIERETGFRGAQVTVRFLFYDLTTQEPASEARVVFRGIANAAEETTEAALRVTFTNRLNLQRIVLPEVRIQRRCPWVFPSTPEQRLEALDGGAKGKYSGLYRCGYSADQSGGLGALEGGQPFTSCDYTRSACSARGMFELGRFGGVEFVPAQIEVRSFGETGSHLSPVVANEARYNDFVPLVYGTAWYQPPVVVARNDGNLTHVEVLLGMGEIEDVVKVIVNDVEIPEGVNGADMTGTGWYNLITSGARSGSVNPDFTDGDPYGSMATASVVVPNRISDGQSLPRVRVLLRGLKLERFDEDGAPLGETFTNNPAWVLLDVLRRSGWLASEIDLASFARAAAYCDEAIETTDLYNNTVLIPRFQCNLVVNRRWSAAEVARGIRNGSSLLLTYGSGGLLTLRVENTMALQQPVKPDGSNSAEVLNGGWPAYEFSDGSAEFSGILRKPGGEPTIRLYLGLSYTYQVATGDALEDIVQAITDGMNGPTSPLLTATRTGTTIRVFYPSAAGANGNRFGVYSSTSGSATWDAAAKTLANGTSPTKWRVTIDFSSLVDRDGASVPTNKIRKLRWTYAADLQGGAFDRSEFEAVISNWDVSGTGRAYSVAGPGSRRFEDVAVGMNYSGSWTVTRGNFSGGSIHSTLTEGDAVGFQYAALQTHRLYLGTRYTGSGAEISIVVDEGAASTVNLRVPGEDVLIRWPVGEYGSGTHTVTITHAGPAGADFYFDFLELAVPATTLPVFPDEPRMTLATDWDTDHSIALAPERTAWLIDTLGFKGRQNHYVGALWFYELVNPGNVYATGTVTFGGTPEPGEFVSIFLGRDDDGASPTEIQRGMHGGDTLESIAISFAQEFNRGYTGVWASVSGSVVTIHSRSLGADGNHYTLDSFTTGSTLTVSVSATFSGGETGTWRTDLTATPRLNRAARDWSRSFFTALDGYGIDVAAAFSTELRDVDPSVGAGMVQRGPDGDAIQLQTPAYQTNFSPTSLAFWKQVYLDQAAMQADAGLQPYLQFGEVQWWYFPNDGLGNAFSGMPFYDAWTAAEFATLYGRAMAVFTENTADPAAYPDEVAFLRTVIGNFTDAIMTHVRATYPTARFEVLYPLDVNQTEFNRAINYPPDQWTAATLDCLKTEGFGFTLQRNLDKSELAMRLSGFPEFPAAQRSHLVGVGDAITAWVKEARFAQGRGFESVVLFALDQMCLIGYGLPLPELFRRSVRLGS